MSLEIEIKEDYKSLKKGKFFLSDFSVITGKNGSGKTHLLEALSKINIATINYNGKILKKIMFMGYNTLEWGLHSTSDTQNSIEDKKEAYWNKFSGLRKRYQSYPKEQFLINLNNNGLLVNEIEFTEKMLKEINKEFQDIEKDDFKDFPDKDLLFGGSGIFRMNIANIFKNYQTLKLKNEFLEFLKKEKGNEVLCLTQEEFENKYGIPPWDFLNKILSEKIEVNYIVNNPENIIEPEEIFILKFLDKNKQIEIETMNISSGEKVLIALALAVYNLEKDSEKAELILLDEPDASLHPSMSIKMIEILNDMIVKKEGIPVVMTTHSPTTVILSEANSIYEMTSENKIPTKADKQKVIESLICDIPFLKISDNPKRQVFVESKYDVKYLEKITNILSYIRKENHYMNNIIFIQASSGEGSSCEDVKNVMKAMGNNEYVYGILDWDTKNISKKRQYVLGENNREEHQRYAIDNYILDPLSIGLLNIYLEKSEFQDYGIKDIRNLGEIKEMKKEDAQKIVDKVLLDINLLTNDKVTYELENGWKLEISKKFCEKKGHDVEKDYKTKYGWFCADEYRGDDKLKMKILNTIVENYPEYTVKALFEIIEKIV